MKRYLFVMLTVFAVLILSQSVLAREIRLASWNMRWVNSIEFAPGDSGEAERTVKDYNAMREYAKKLQGDVVALQEVGDAEAAYHVFSQGEYTVLLSGRDDPQQTGFALRKGIPFVDNGAYKELGEGDTRYGTDITIFPNSDNALRLLSVHLKSGCFSNRHDEQGTEACSKFQRNMEVLEQWIDARAKEKIPFVVMGDWNRRLLENGDSAWAAIDDKEPKGLQLVNSNQGAMQSVCLVKTWNKDTETWNDSLKNYPAPIDHIILDGRAASFLSENGFEVVTFTEEDSLAYNLSDHCPIYTDMTLPDDKVSLLEADTLHMDRVKLRIMAANITSGNKQSYDLGHGIRIFKGFKPDVVLIQEFNYKENSQKDIKEFVSTTFGEGFQYYRESDAQIPNGVISRWPILDSGKWEDSFAPNREYVWAKIDIPGNIDLWAVSLHFLTKNSRIRKAEARELVAKIKERIPEEDYLVVGGDLNTRNVNEPALKILDEIIDLGPFPEGPKGGKGTNSSRKKPYDWVFADADLNQYQVQTEVGSRNFPKGIIFDSRVYGPLSDVTPVERGDSAAPNMQHMAVVKDFLLYVHE
ncbi:MAG: endonuclease/exonuclease/phosphatase family protein [Candidatus Electrothrix aestuarii]|uniref:Endonuclease/exonuclease/phosphatase family protein n=1 Tax=Candidatus Electrothrix aestuarii TaxID=3062594 RepID=A0AAU8LS42_9BACT|nr:endonuclease/exonuclease/phosphatase family protein [Candidatus Electrothrix aestuarii]